MRVKTPIKSIPQGGPRLKAILFFDLVESSRLMSRHENATVDFLQRAFEVFRERGDHHNGQVIKTTGDGALALFDAASDAVEYATEVLRAVRELPTELDERPSFRAGVHVGEVQYRDGDVYGHAVNIAARLESIAGSGEICVSAELFALVHRNSRFTFEAVGGRRLKNIPELMAVYVVREPSPGRGQANWPELNIATIGGLRLDGAVGAPPRRKDQYAPIGYLALNTERSEMIGRLCALFWPERPPAQARRALNGLLRSMTELYGNVTERDVASVGLASEGVNIDLRVLEQDLRMGRVDPMLLHIESWPERILAGTEEIGSLYASWLQVTRSDWRTRIAQALELCLGHFELGDDGLRDAATALLRIEPGHERAARLLIRHYHLVDNPGAAVRVYDELVCELDRRFGIAPKAETLAAVGGKSSRVAPPDRRPAAPLRIQVLAFRAENSVVAEKLESFRSEILASLACFRGWAVAEGEQPGAGAATHSDYRLEARVVGTEPELTVALTLTEAPTVRIAWTETFGIGTGNLVEAERSAVARIAAALEVYLSTDRLSFARPDPARTVVDDWLRAERIFFRWTPESHEEAADIHRDLIARAPDYAPAHASLAGMQNVQHIVRPGAPRDPKAGRWAYDLAERAAELDPLDARNQLAVAWSASLAGDFDKASIHMEMAARLNPNSPRTLVSCAMGFAFFGEHDRAQAAMDHSLACAPMLTRHQWCYAAAVYFFAGRLEEALDAVVRGRDGIIDNPGWHAAILTQMRRHDEAVVAFDTLVETVRPLWAGDGPPTPEAIYAWFIDAYPIRRARERKLLDFLN